MPTDFPQISYRRGASGRPAPVVRGTGIRVQTIAVAAERWGWTPSEMAGEYNLSLAQVEAALAFYDAHCREIDLHIEAEERLAAEANE